MSITLIVIVGINLLLAVVSFFFKWLTISGGIASVIVGSTIFWSLGYGGYFLLLLFFLSSTLLGKVRTRYVVAKEKKEGPRDWAQVAANGVFAVISALLYRYSGELTSLVMFGASLATATADTWGTETGLLSETPPVSIRTLRQVEKGSSGGITPLGTMSSMIGSILIAMSWYSHFAPSFSMQWLFLASIVALSGIAGAFVDSYLGATLQGHYWDEENQKLTEWEFKEGKKLELVRGIRFIDNDVVNALSNLSSLLLASGLSLLVL
ncbi:MAG: DUF92 domain-containing protein [Sphaerochaetaceae bacterium]